MNRRYYAPSFYSPSNSSKRSYDDAFNTWTQHISNIYNTLSPHLQPIGNALLGYGSAHVARSIRQATNDIRYLTN